MITLMVVAGIALLIAIGYLNHVAENGKLEKARTKVELGDRLRRCSEITEVFPGQLMSPALKLLLARLELNVVQRMLNMEKGNAQLKHRIGERLRRFWLRTFTPRSGPTRRPSPP